MRILVDTHVFLWDLLGDHRSSRKAKEVLRSNEHELVFSLVSLWEITVKIKLGKLSAAQVTAKELAGEPITSILTEAPGNHAPIGGLKVTTENGWFAARPSGTEDVYKIYAESFNGQAHLTQIQTEAKALVASAIA